mgnify:CR=1 FL=1
MDRLSESAYLGSNDSKNKKYSGKNASGYGRNNMNKTPGYFLLVSVILLILLITALCIRERIGNDRASASSITSTIEPKDSVNDESSKSESESGKSDASSEEETTIDPYLTSSAIVVDLLTPNEYSRPQIPLSEVNAVVIHYVGNPGTTAAQNRNYYENQATEHNVKVSSHYIIGLDGEIIQCVPLDEIAYASNHRNSDTISIECCHPDETGEFTSATYKSLVKLTAALCNTYGLKPSATDSQYGVIRHYDVTGKTCPLYFVENEDEWVAFKAEVSLNMNK